MAERYRNDHTYIRDLEDGTIFNDLANRLCDIPVADLTDRAIPHLTGKSVLVLWMMRQGAHAGVICATLHLSPTQLQGICGTTLVTLHLHVGETVILDSEVPT